ncbi:IPT/TIG domain-containing protein [Candidatus Daviesbacteria bacterium]|nr:IPT/TIG domain-containing protein [Candidatus Daviesbacteria bacterium]
MNIKVIIAILVVAVLAVAIPVTFRLAQTQQIFQPKAADALSVTCSASPNPANIGQSVSWSASARGGSGSYEYAWGDSATGQGGPSASVTYSSGGTKKAHIDVRDLSDNQVAGGDCTVTINQTAPPTTAAPTSAPTSNPTSAPTSDKVCTANLVVGIPECRKCNAQGTGYFGERGSDYPLPQGSTAWCACAKGRVDEAFYKANCEQEPTPTQPPAGGNPDDGSTCNYKIFDPTTRATRLEPYLISGKDYIIEVTMKNVGKTIWKPNAYKLAFERNKSDWGGADQALDREVAPNGEKVFDVRVKAPATTGNEHRRAEFYIRMQNNAVGFGAACEPQNIDITPPGVPPTYTQCYVISEFEADVNKVKSCDTTNEEYGKLVRPYTSHPLNLTYPFKEPITRGEKRNLYVKFFDNNNKPSNDGVPYTETIVFNVAAPAPVISGINCKYIQNELGTLITVNGTNFGTQGKGTVKVGSQQAEVAAWNNTAISASVDQRLETSTRVTVTLDDGKTVADNCAVNTTTLTFTARNQCIKDNNFAASNVDVKIFENGSEPIFRQQIRLDKDGKPQSFAPKLEKNKKYTMLLKAPGALAKKVEFNTGSNNTTIIDPFTLAVGDIYPRNNPDGSVNNFDISELKRQWAPTKDTQTNADLNNDGRVNNVDWSCLRLNVGKSDEEFTPSQTSPQTVKIGNKGKVFMDTNLDKALSSGEQTIAGAVVKFLKVPDSHVVGEKLTATELAASLVLAQATSDASGSVDIQVSRTAPVVGNFSFVVDPGANTGKGGELDWKILEPLNADSIQSFNIAVEP